MQLNALLRTGSIFLATTLLAFAGISCKDQKETSTPPAMPLTQAVKESPNEPPPAAREFRAAWVATVGNIDWPSRSGLSTEQQQKEIIQILDRSAELNINAIILQVRTTADALYDSKLEPWSAFLTGTQGKAPSPYYDPLKFWIDQAHARGIELHAWFNPYRTKYGGSKLEAAATHISKTHPELVKSYGSYGWMDPGEPAAQDHSFNVFMDVVDRYDVDGIHIDDYFYPYPEPLNPDDKKDKRELQFPDDASYKKYRDAGGTLVRDDWRRDSINQLIHRIYDGLRARKKTVQFGISPFGIPRPGLKGIEYVKGFDQYEKLYADTVLWLQNGWCDYMVPQLYWKIGAPNQPYLGLLNWWTHNNPKGRHIYGGLFTSRIDFSDNSWSPDEILGQIMITRLTPGAQGNVHFSQIAFNQNRQKIGDLLRDGLYAQPALVPATTWLDNTPPAAPIGLRAEPTTPPATVPAATAPAVETIPAPAAATVPAPTTVATTTPSTRRSATAPFRPLATQPAIDAKLGAVRITWVQPVGGEKGGEKAWQWAVYYKQGDAWKMKIVPGDQTETTIRDTAAAMGGATTQVAVSAVDRSGNESKRTLASVSKSTDKN